VRSIWVESSTRLGGFRALKNTTEAPYTTKVNNRERTTRGTTPLYCHVSALPCPPSLRSLRISSVYAIGRPPTVPSHPFIVLIVCAPRLHAAQAHPLCDRAQSSRRLAALQPYP